MVCEHGPVRNSIASLPDDFQLVREDHVFLDGRRVRFVPPHRLIECRATADEPLGLGIVEVGEGSLLQFSLERALRIKPVLGQLIEPFRCLAGRDHAGIVHRLAAQRHVTTVHKIQSFGMDSPSLRAESSRDVVERVALVFDDVRKLAFCPPARIG